MPDRGDPVAAELQERRARGIRTALTLAAVIVVLRYLPLTSHLFFYALVENYAYDVVFDARAPQPPGDLAILAIDDYSLKRLGKWPWPRDVFARLLDQLPAARAVAFDVLFIEPDRYNPQGDRLFAEAIRRHGRVVLGAYRQEQAELEAGRQPGLTAYAMPAGGPGPAPPIQALNFQGPIAELAQAAAGTGYVDISPDSDGVHRRVEPLRLGYDGKLYPHFATEIARVISNEDGGAVVEHLGAGRLTFETGAGPVPLSREGSLLINYCGPMGTVPTFSVAKVLAGEVPAKDLEGKILIVGATAPGLYDIRPAPFRASNRKFFGVETNASIVASLIERPMLKDSGRSLAWLAAALVLGVVAGLLVWSSGEVLGPLLGVLVLVVLALPSFFVAFFAFGAVVPYGAIVLATLLPVAVGAMERMGAERKMIQRQFGTYVSPRVLEELVRNPEMVRRGQRREVTVLFSDVRGSTTLAESLSPETWLAQLNEYLTAMSTMILDEDGYLDKFMGDGIMAVWNTFGNQPDHAERALRSGEKMLRALALLNQHWEQAEDRTPFKIGIGIHTGDAVVGNVGSEERTQYTAIGDAINTGARLESMTKEHGVPLLVSETTAALLRAKYTVRPIAEVGVRGRAGKIHIYAVEGESGASTTPAAAEAGESRSA